MSEPCTSAAPFSAWHKVHSQAVHEFKFPRFVPWWVAYRYAWVRWFPWERRYPQSDHDAAVWTPMQHYHLVEAESGGQAVRALAALHEHVSESLSARSSGSTFSRTALDLNEDHF